MTQDEIDEHLQQKQEMEARQANCKHRWEESTFGKMNMGVWDGRR